MSEKKKLKNKMYNFGELGSWSLDTLKHNLYYKHGLGGELWCVEVKLIEDKYEELKEKKFKRFNYYSKLFRKPNRKKSVSSEAYNSFSALLEIKNEMDDLNEDYNDYASVMDFLTDDLEDK